jgi:hypothetical protein
MRLFVLSIVLALTALCGAARAQCVNGAHLSCDVYNKCFARYCHCNGTPYEYFLSYGRRYCDRFLASTGWSPAGDKWRDTTLLCLQESIVPKLDISDHPTCDCKAMKEFAFKTHVACYTKPGASICSLSLGDFTKIAHIIDLADDLFKDPYGRAQARQILDICRNDQNSTIPRPVLDVIASIINRL